MSAENDGQLYDVSVWDHEGNIIKKFWSVSYAGAQFIRDDYADDPMHAVVVEECQ